MANNKNSGPGHQGPTEPVWGTDDDGNAIEVGHTHESWEERCTPGEHTWHQVNGDSTETVHTYNDDE